MHLRHLKLNEFRNYQGLDLPLRPGMTIFHGRNGAGKTNILEAIYLTASGQSSRVRFMDEMVRFGSNQAFVGIQFTSGGSDWKIEVGLAAGKDRQLLKDHAEHAIEATPCGGRCQIKINGAIKRRSDLAGLAPAVYFSADDLVLVKGEPGARRRFLDFEISAINRRYHSDLTSYRRAIEQRNRLLREVRNGRALPSSLAPWEHAAARYGANIILARRDFVAALAPEAAEAHARLAGREKVLTVRYLPSIGLSCIQIASDNEKGAAELVENIIIGLEDLFCEHRPTDIAQGTSGYGPHREEIELLLSGSSVRAFASQGEQRSCALALRLGLAGVLHKITRERPALPQ